MTDVSLQVIQNHLSPYEMKNSGGLVAGMLTQYN